MASAVAFVWTLTYSTDFAVPFVNLFGSLLLITFVHITLNLAGFADFTFITWLWGSLVVSAVRHVLIGLAAARADRGLYTAMLYIPRYAVWKFLLYLSSKII
jgi:hypothetical protein